MLITSYSETNKNNDNYIDYRIKFGQVFTPSSNYQITSIKFYLQKVGSPTGNLTAKIYASNGTIPTGSAIITSSAVDVTTISSSYSLITFNVTTDTLIYTGNNYVVAIESDSVQSINYINVGSYFSLSINNGKSCTKFSSFPWIGNKNMNLCFYIYGDEVPWLNEDKSSTSWDNADKSLQPWINNDEV